MSKCEYHPYRKRIFFYPPGGYWYLVCEKCYPVERVIGPLWPPFIPEVPYYDETEWL